ncbi:alpha/beta hydrolase family protein [Desulfatibacillum aliphaticivorans]|uniref:alpha/beta hydrolase family protein n=1 Tax=Desulfatibacillum aliphaticivorans TaxID=218208 RepID=UPI000402AB6C|nr:YqiA/YcfP family alpha/beta fold hydrolase [Desulfatibacillum aliphaticivorans]
MLNKLSKPLDFAGGCVDGVFLMLPKILKPFAKSKVVDKDSYMAQVEFYLDQGYADDPASFFDLPEAPPEYPSVNRDPFLDGQREHITWESGFEAKNPLLREEYASYLENRTAHMLRWTHGEPGRKTVVCLHGFMLGEPDQAERMFKVKKLYNMGLDVALLIAPFHWERAPSGPGAANIALQPDNVPMTAEFMGQIMFDLASALLLLKKMDAGELGLIGASMGGYTASLFSCLSDMHSFAAMMVPAVNFSKPIGPDTVSMPFAMDKSMKEKVNKVWEFHSPLHLTPKIPRDRILVIASKGDRICPFEYVEALCRKWQGIRCTFMTGGHWMVFNGKLRGQAWYGFLHDMEFI